MATATEQTLPVAGNVLKLQTAGNGPPLLLLGHDIGGVGWTALHDELARANTIYAPSHLGWDGSERPEWMRSVRDLAVVYQWLLSDLGAQSPALVGLGFGGWVAAEMATMQPRGFSSLTLVGAMGLQPASGEIYDQALVNAETYIKTGLVDEANFSRTFGELPDTDQLEQWEINREMTFRIAWRPYMYSQTLPHLLGGVRAPALVIHGRNDRVVPLDCSEQYARLLPHAKLEVLPDCGHFAVIDQPQRLAGLVAAFAGGAVKV